MSPSGTPAQPEGAGGGASADVTAYLDALVRVLRGILGDALVGAYLHGSGIQGDHRQGKSDIDVLAVTSGPVSLEQKERLAAALAHAALPVPAAGLDLMIVTRETIDRPVREPEYELWFSTGATWSTEINTSGRTSEVLITLATCHAGARTAWGVEAGTLFRPIPRDLILASMIDALEWHRTKILDDFHDPLGQHSILNASRNWMHAAEGRLGSKAEGGRWVLAREPDHPLVQHALRARDGEPVTAPAASDIDAFLQRVLGICRASLTGR